MGKRQLVDRLVKSMRKMEGTSLEPIRNGVIAIVRSMMDAIFRFQDLTHREEVLHPLSAVISKQVGDPFKRWNIEDIAGFRSEFGSMLDYLPRNVSAQVSNHETIIESQSVAYRLFTPTTLKSKTRIVYLHGGGFVLETTPQTIRNVRPSLKRQGVT